MAKNYLTYPCKTMRITQNYYGTVSHAPNSNGSPKDYPWDEGCSDQGRDWLYCPCDTMEVKRIYGVGGAGTNTIWLQSRAKVDLADGTKDFVTLLVTHPDDDDLSKLKVGQIFYRGEKICREGKDDATGYHFHMSVAKGKYTAPGWGCNNKGAWVLRNNGTACKPEKLFLVDKTFTKVVNSALLDFKTLPTVKYYPAYKGDATNLDTILAAIKVPLAYRGSWTKRKPLAKANGISLYIGSFSQNTKLIELAKAGRLKKI